MRKPHVFDQLNTLISEAELQQLLYDSPELLDTDDAGSIIEFVRESGLPGSGFTDLIGVDCHGNVLIVETKLARNREIRRTVIGQVMEYAAFLWRMPFDEFDRFFIARKGKSILDLMAEKDSNVLKEELRRSIADKLASGDFDLLIAVDAVNPEVDKIIAFLSSRSGGLKFEALEVESYKQGSTEVLVPRRRAQIGPVGSISEGGRKKITLEEILSSCPDEHSRRLFDLLQNTWTSFAQEKNCVVDKLGRSLLNRASSGNSTRSLIRTHL